MKTKLDDLLGGAALTLLVAHAVLIILSWLLSAMGQEDVRSLLSSEGIRWFVGSFSAMTASPLLVWLLLLLSAAGCVRQSGVAGLWGQHRTLTYRERIALRVALFFLVGYVVIVGLLTLVPHAILLSATGQLFPSAFSRSLLPIVAFGVCLFSVAYGVMAGRLRSLGDVLHSLSFGIARGASLVILYILLIQFYESLRFVFG